MKSSIETAPDRWPAYIPPEILKKTAMITKAGITIRAATIFGPIKKDGVFTPMISKASICSEIRMVPSSDAMFDPTFPANTRQVIVGANSMSVESLTTLPITESFNKPMTN